MSRISSWILAVQNAPRIYWAGTAAAVAHPRTRRFGFHAASYGARVTGKSSVATTRVLLTTPFVRGGYWNLGKAGGSVAAGYISGAIVGTVIAEQAYGESGKQDAIDLYTGRVSFDPRKKGNYFSTIGGAVYSKLKAFHESIKLENLR